MTWGSSVQPVRETIALAGAHGISVKLVAMRLISPAQPARLAAALAGVKRLLIVEQSPMPDFVFGNSASTYNPWSRNLNGASKTAANEIFAEISAPTETIAASDLQKRLLEVAAASAVIVHSIQAQVGAEATPQQLRRITAELTFDGKIESLQQFLFEVETNVPFIFVDTVRAQPLPTHAKKGLEDITLRVTLTASSNWKSHELNDKG